MSKTFKLKMWQPKQKEAIHVGRFDVPKSMQPIDLSALQPVRMYRQGHEEVPPAAEIVVDSSSSSAATKLQNQLTELRKKPLLMDAPSKRIKLQGNVDAMSGKYFIFESDPEKGDTFNAIPIRDFYRFTTRPDLKELTLEEAEAQLQSKERAPRTIGPLPSASAAPEDQAAFTMTGLSVYGYKVRDDELDEDLKKAQEEDGEERDFAEKWDDDNPEDRVSVSERERLKLDEEEKKLKRSLRNTARAERKAPADEDDSDDDDSADEFAKNIEEEQQLASAAESGEIASRGKKRKAEDTPAPESTKRVKLDPDHLPRDFVLEEIKKLLRARRMPKREFLAALKQRVNLSSAHNKSLMLDIVTKCVVTHKENNTEVLALKDDLFAK